MWISYRELDRRNDCFLSITPRKKLPLKWRLVALKNRIFNLARSSQQGPNR